MLLTATVTGPGAPFSYHWAAQSPTSGGTSANYDVLSATFTNVTADAGGNSTAYTLTVTNTCGFAASANATVSIAGAGTDKFLVIAPTVVPSGALSIEDTCVQLAVMSDSGWGAGYTAAWAPHICWHNGAGRCISASSFSIVPWHQN